MKALVAALVVAAMATFALAQATRPADAKSGITKVYLAPFTETGGTLIRPGWLSSRLNDAISKDLSMFATVQLLKPRDGQTPPRPEEGAKAHLDQARQAGAEIAIAGKTLVTGDKLAVTGDVYDLASGNSIGVLKAEGASNDLFKVQDTIVSQIRQVVARVVGANPNAPMAGENVPGTASNAGRYPGSALQRAVIDPKDLKGLDITSAGTKYDQQPYHTVEQPDINFEMPYYYGGYGYGNYYGWPSYSYYGYGYPGYGYGGWGWGDGLVIIQQNNNVTTTNNNSAPANNNGNNGNNSDNGKTNTGNDRNHRHGGGTATASGDRPARASQGPLVTSQPPLIRSAPPAPRQAPAPSSGNTMQSSPGYEIRPVTRAPKQ